MQGDRHIVGMLSCGNNACGYAQFLFSSRFGRNEEGTAITHAVITMAHVLPMPAVCEGVETSQDSLLYPSEILHDQDLHAVAPLSGTPEYSAGIH
jgi:hypothetical protein